MALATQTTADVHRLRLAQSGQEHSIALLLERLSDSAAGNDQPRSIESTLVFPHESVKDLKLRLRRSKQWFKSGDLLVRAADLTLACMHAAAVHAIIRPAHLQVYSDGRELLDHELVRTLATRHSDASGHFLHLYVKLQDVASLRVTGARTGSIEVTQPMLNGRALPRSVLTASLAAQAARYGRGKYCVSRQALHSGKSEHLSACRSDLDLVEASATGSPAAPGDALVHLIIRRGAKVAWEHHSDELEIHVQSDITAAEAKSHIEQRGKVSADFRLVFNGQVRCLVHVLSRADESCTSACKWIAS